MTRSGRSYLGGLNDGRRVMVDGHAVTDVAGHPAFAGAVRSIARHYDNILLPGNRELMTYESPKTGERVSRAFEVPRSREDFESRRHALRANADLTFGLMGRNPDHVAAFLAAWAARADVFARGGQEFADNIVRFYEHVRDNDLYATYAIVPPQIDRSKPAHQQADPHLYAGVVAERDGGIVVKGAQMLATGAALSDYVILGNIQPLRPGDENHAICVAIPIGAPGVKVYSRRSYASAANSVFDYPLSTQFDETDALMVFDNVFVPWEHVFVYRDIDVSSAIWTQTPAHLLGNHQAQIRLSSKLDFLLGLAHRIAEMTGNLAAPPVRGVLGEMAALTRTVSGLVLAQEQNCRIDEFGVAWPGVEECFALMTLQSELYPRLLQMMRDLCGGGMIQLPSSVEDYANPEMAADLEKYVSSPGHTSRERVKLFKLAWDLVGSEFGSRHHQYEMFYVGAPFIVRQRTFATFDFGPGRAMVEAALAGYDEAGPVAAPASTLSVDSVA
jgi:4-hydroxyphenylacetate 3-monooxygenase